MTRNKKLRSRTLKAAVIGLLSTGIALTPGVAPDRPKPLNPATVQVLGRDRADAERVCAVLSLPVDTCAVGADSDEVAARIGKNDRMLSTHLLELKLSTGWLPPVKFIESVQAAQSRGAVYHSL